MGLFKKSNVSKDLINLVSAADGGDKSAAIKIAELSRDGHVTVPEICEARIIIYEPAAKRGDKEARYWVGFSLQTLDPPASFKWLVDLAREGDTRAMKALGSGFSVLAYYGEDEEKELYWYLEAAKLGDAEAQCDAGREYYIKGMSSHKDPEQRDKYFDLAKEWYQKAAKQHYVQGVLGLSELAIRLGDDCTNDVFKRHNFDFQSPAMQEELKTAKEKAKEYFEKAAKFLYSVVDGELEDCVNEEAAKAFDMLGDMFSRNLLGDEPPDYNEAVRLYFFATMYDVRDNLISEKKMNDLIKRESLVIAPEEFEAWKQEILGE